MFTRVVNIFNYHVALFLCDGKSVSVVILFGFRLFFFSFDSFEFCHFRSCVVCMMRIDTPQICKYDRQTHREEKKKLSECRFVHHNIWCRAACLLKCRNFNVFPSSWSNRLSHSFILIGLEFGINESINSNDQWSNIHKQSHFRSANEHWMYYIVQIEKKKIIRTEKHDSTSKQWIQLL